MSESSVSSADGQGQNLASPETAAYWPGQSNTAKSDESAPYLRSGQKKGDLLKMYAVRVRASRKWRHEQYDQVWKRLVDLYRGKHFLQTQPQSFDDRIAINICFATVNTIVPSLSVNDPMITVNARSKELEQAAESLEAGLNYWWRHYKWKTEVKRAVKDSVVTGNGWVKLGWLYTEKKRKLSDDEKQQQFGQMQQQVQQAAMANPAIAADLPTDDDIYDGIDSDTWDVVHDHPFVHRTSPFDIFVDPEAMADDDLKWIAQRIIAPFDRVVKDSRYKASARKNLQPDMASNPRWRDDTMGQDGLTTGSISSTATTDDIKRVTLWEYWDIEQEYYCVFAEKGEGFLVDPTDFPYPFGHPFVHLGNYEVVDQFYSLGDLEMLEPIQHELNGVRSDMMNHRKRWQRAYLAKRDKLDSEAMNVLASDEDGRVIYIDGDENLSEIIVPLQQTALDPQMYQYSETIEDDADLVSGISEYQRGQAPDITRTATEANMIQSNTNARVADKLAQVEEFMAKIAERVAQLAQIYLTQQEVARIVGPDGQQSWVTFERDDIQGEYDFAIEAGSTTPKDDADNRQEAMQLVQSLQPFVGSVVDPQALISYMLKNAFDIKDPTQFFVQQQPQSSPKDQIIQTLNYKDAPPDVQREIEQEAGLTPSQVGGSSQIEQQQAQAQQEQQMEAQSQQGDQAQSAQDAQEQTAQAQHDAQIQQEQQGQMQALRLQQLEQAAQQRQLPTK